MLSAPMRVAEPAAGENVQALRRAPVRMTTSSILVKGGVVLRLPIAICDAHS
jgi:hypothetical protein